MRKLYPFLAATMLAFGATAQTTVYFDDFESNSLEGYTLHNLDGLTPNADDLATMVDSAWTIRTITAQGWPHNLSAFSVSWYTVLDQGPSDDWLITPEITVAGDAKLTWDALAITSSGNFRDRYQVYVVFSTNIDEILDDVNTDLIFDTGAEGEIASPTSREVDLAAEGYENTSFYIAFRNFTAADDGNELAIDNIMVTDNSEPTSTRESELFLNAKVQPNPATGSSTNVLFRLEQSEQIFVETIDLTGKVISIENRGMLSPGSHMIQVDRNGLAAGLYFVRLRTADHAHVMRVAFQ